MRLGRWETLRELGRGGQGTAYLALDTTAIDVPALADDLRVTHLRLNGVQSDAENRRLSAHLLELIETYLGRESAASCGALKLLHEAARLDAKALARLRMELEVLGSIEHPSLLSLRDSSIEGGWYVSPFYRDSTLANTRMFVGRPDRALAAFRQLVEGVAMLHERRVVHRDIKPENIFLSQGGLVLGDFGIVSFHDPQHTRISDSYENVGSRDWMPGWAMGIRLDDVTPAFDVFSLGKVLWSMIAGGTKMQLWYYDHDAFNLERKFPGDERMALVNQLLLSGCVVERERDCCRSAPELLPHVDRAIAAVRRCGQVIGANVKRFCLVCGIGSYRLAAEGGSAPIRNLGISPAGTVSYKYYECDYCGHVQLFRMDRNPPGWG